MNRKKTFPWAIVMIVCMSVLSAGCGGDGSSSSSVSGPSSVTSVIWGVVSDGPIQNARVSLDLNHNGAYDNGEPFSITNANGQYRIEYILDPGTDYMLIVEGSTALNTTDPADNPGGPLDFAMFFSLTSAGSRSSVPSTAVYQVNATPVTFRSYLVQLDSQVGGINDASIQNIISSTDDSVTLFQSFILDDGVIKASVQAVAVQVAQIVDVENTRKDLQLVGDALDIPSGSVLDFTDGKTIQDLSDDLIYQNTTVSVIGDLVVSTPLSETTVEDVTLTNMNSMETAEILTFTVEPDSLPAYDVSVTPYQSVLEIPQFSDIRANDDVVVLGADITATDSSGTRKIDQLLACSVSSDPANFYTGLVYYYFDGSQWVNGGPLSAAMTIRTAPFVVVKSGNITTKTITIDGLSQLDTPTVIIRGYMDTDSTETVLTLDALSVNPASDTVSVKIPDDFIISEVIVVDSELSKVSADGTPSLSLPVTDDTTQTIVLTASLSDGGTDMILDATLYSALKDGSQDQDFAGVGAYIDTKIVYRGIDMFLGLSVDNAVESIINENIDRYLNNANPVFYSGTGDFDGVTIDDVNHRIEVVLTEQNASTTVSWSFALNTVVRTYQKDCTAGTGDGSAYSSTYTFTNASGSLTNVFFEESVSERTDTIQTLSATYEGSAVYDRATGALASSKFYQKLREYNSVTKKTDVLYGLADMDNGTMSFNGSYSFYLRSYGTVSGSVNITNGAYAKGYDLNGTVCNNNDLGSAQALFSASTSYIIPSTNPAWLVGVWTGSFTDNCGANDGQLTMTVTDTNATWWGQSDDMSRNYGTTVSVSDSTVTLLDNATIWSTGSKISDTRIEGSWSYNGCFGTYYLDKQ